MSVHPFREGQKVVCVSDDNGVLDMITVGDIYIVAKIWGSDEGGWQVLVRNEFPKNATDWEGGWFLAHRFGPYVLDVVDDRLVEALLCVFQT